MDSPSSSDCLGLRYNRLVSMNSIETGDAQSEFDDQQIDKLPKPKGSGYFKGNTICDDVLTFYPNIVDHIKSCLNCLSTTHPGIINPCKFGKSSEWSLARQKCPKMVMTERLRTTVLEDNDTNFALWKL